ncbi:hypothetical protein C8F04DRAFT_595623 [Mycena alexandri]|uniref:F-box domain-containing protein n=1 Tax=Mycena alexandri TaxID=1745969 RepID=A0AAD6XA30_9AGAR|nr:hypothetical protein C8F04DRAFT_595623 [Mycena alexandri]
METRRRALQTRLDYPVLTLPPEITSEIFLHCLPETRELDVVNPREAPLLLTHVCRAWRQIASSLPALWTTFQVMNVVDFPRLFRIAEIWFTHSRQCPISVKVYGSLRLVNNFAGLRETFRQHSGRMHSLDLQVSVENLEKMNSDGLDFGLLQKLSLRLFDADVDDDDPITMFGNVPLLRELLMSEAPPSFVPLPWQQLTKFTGEIFTPAQSMEALHLMPNLVDCAFSVFRDDEGDLKVFTHTKIQHFSIFGSMDMLGTSADSAQLIALITLPVLRTLEIHDVDDFEGTPLDSMLASFLSRSKPPLHKISVRRFSADNGRPPLPLTPSFTNLGITHLEIWQPSDFFLQPFFKSFASDPRILPKLQNLSLPGCRDENGEMTVYEILELAATPITERRNLTQCARLESFRVVEEAGGIDCSFPLPQYLEEHLLSFRNLKAAGMEIYLGSEEKSFV